MNAIYIAQAAAGQEGDPLNMLITFGLIGVIFYFLLIRPQRKQQKELKERQESLKPGDKVILSGTMGDHGTAVMLERSGLMEATKILSGIEGIGQTTLTNKDVVRHPLVQKIILAYEKFENKKRGDQDGKKERRFPK